MNESDEEVSTSTANDTREAPEGDAEYNSGVGGSRPEVSQRRVRSSSWTAPTVGWRLVGASLATGGSAGSAFLAGTYQNLISVIIVPGLLLLFFPPPWKRSRRGAISSTVAVAGALTVPAALFTVQAFGGPSVSVRQPQGGGAVAGETGVWGVARNVPRDARVWPVVRQTSRSGAPYHPHEGPCPVFQDNRFHCTVKIGGEQEEGEEFTILVLLADEETQAAFKVYLDSDQESGFPGLPSLPDSANDDVRAEVAVTRAE